MDRVVEFIAMLRKLAPVVLSVKDYTIPFFYTIGFVIRHYQGVSKVLILPTNKNKNGHVTKIV